MNLKINVNDKFCPCCGHPKNEREQGKALCFYCLVRSQLGTVKLLTLQVLQESDRHMTVREIAAAMNSHEMNTLNGKPRRTFSRHAVSTNLKSYSSTGYRLCTKRKSRKIEHRNGRPPLLYKISKKGKRFLIKYKNRYLRGHSAVIPNHNHHKHYTPYELRVENRTGENKTKSLSIKKSDKFKFIFGECFKDDWNRTDGATG